MSPTDWQTLREQIDQLEDNQKIDQMKKIQAMLIANNKKRARFAVIPSDTSTEKTDTTTPTKNHKDSILDRPFNTLLSLEFILQR